MTIPGPDDIEAAKTRFGGWTEETLAGWGVPWPPPEGWQNRLLDAYFEAHRDDPDPFADATPSCPNCLHPLDAGGNPGREHWLCPSCGHVSL